MAKPKFWKFDHPILDSLPPFNSDGIPDLVERIQQGDKLAKEELLYQLLGYVKTRLGRLLYKDSRLRHDVDGLISHLIFWLVKLIDQVSKGKQGLRIVNYVSTTLKFRCFRYLGTLLAYGPIDHRWYTGTVQSQLGMDLHPERQEVTELLECLESIAKTDNEREFIRLRTEGYKSLEIAKMLDLTETDVSRIRKTLLRRFNDID